jgi:osmotically inducible protein OsmC
MKRKASAVWNGNIKSGKGTISTESGVLNQAQYSFKTRFESGAGTNPEELVGAAHAGCFSMALSLQLEQAGMVPETIQTTATVTMDKQAGGFAITEVHLEVRAKVPGAERTAFEKAAQDAKEGCPISKLFNTKITLEANLLT